MKSKCKEARLLVLTFELVILIALASYSSFSYLNGSSLYTEEDIYLTNFSIKANINRTSLILTQDVYSYGEEVLAYISNSEEVKEINIIGEKELYRFVGIIKNPLRFNPQKPGNYTITAILNNKTELENSFYVTPALKTDKENLVSVSTDKKEYTLGETVIINLNLTKNESYSFSILSKNNVYNYIDVPKGTVKFIPKEDGRYYAQLSKGNESIGFCFFDIKKKEEKIEIIENIKTNKRKYELGETVNIYLTCNITEFKIIIGKESFNFIDVLKNTTFVPKKPGSYEIRASVEDGNGTKTVSYYFSVSDVKETKEKYDYIFNLTENVMVDFDFSEEIEKRKTLIDRILKRQLIEQVISYVKDHSQDHNFSLSLERIENNRFRVYINSNENIKPGIYNLVVEAYIKGELVTQEKTFNWFSEEKRIENITKGKEINLSEIKKHIPYYFDINEEPVLYVDFSNKIKKERNILDIALKKPAAEKISAYIHGEENNTDFVVHIEHIEYDKFKLSVDKNNNIKPDVYKLIAVIKIDNEFFAEQKLFSWGISNVSVLLERIKLKDKKVSLDEAIRTTKVNITKEAINETGIVNEIKISDTADKTPEGKATINETKDIDNLKVNKSITLINLSNKLISEKLVIRNSNNKEVRFELKLNREEIKIVRKIKERKIFGIFRTNVEEEKEVREYDIEINPKEHPLKKIHFNDLKIEENKQAELKIDKLEKEKINLSVKKTMNSFAIDPTSLDFSNAIMTLNAKGSELYKCKDWNFTEQKCYGSWKKIKDIVPGKEYSIELTKEDPAFTEIGLVTINTHKSIYLPNENAFIGIGILDHKGKMVCNASVTLVITNPIGEQTTLTTANGDINISNQCSLYGVTELPDYYTTYKVGGVGSYLMNITAVTYDGTPVMLDNFSVQSFVDFDVVRNGPTRIYPPVSYTMNFTIKANKDYSGPIIELVPKSFAITSQPELQITETQENKILSWNRNLVNGSVYSLYYEFDAPDISPEIFYLGPLSIGTWSESRQWQIASDAQTGTIQDLGTFAIADNSINIGYTTSATAAISTVSKQGNVESETWEIFIETNNDTRITASCQTGIPIKVISATGSGGSYSSYCIDNTPNNATIRCINVPKATNLGTFTFTIEGCEGGNFTYRLESTSSTAGADSFTGSDNLTVNPGDATPPEIVLYAPENNAWKTFQNINFTFNATTNDDFANCSLWTNESGWSLKQVNKSSITNASLNWINETFGSEGDFFWNIKCYDSNENSDFAKGNFTVRIDTSNPNITQEYPKADYYNDTSDPFSVDFNCSITDNMDSKNISLYLTNNQNTSFSFNDSCDITEKDGSCKWTKSLPNGNYTWNCLGYDSAEHYNWGLNKSIKINSSFSVPLVNQIQCEEEGIGWGDCSNIGFNDTLLAVRANCTDSDGHVTNASFNLTNIPDSYNYFYNNASYSDSDWFVLNNSDIVITDSGGFRLDAICYDNDSLTDSSYAEWNIPWGSLSTSLVNPLSDKIVDKDSFFTFTANVDCVGGECGNVSATLDPTEGPSPPASCSGDWIQCNGVYSDGGDAAIGDSGDLEMQLYNFGFTIPSTKILGIQVIHDSWDPEAASSLNISLSWDGGTSWTEEKTRVLSSSETTYTEGNSREIWGRNWTSDEINSNTNFRVRFKTIGNSEEWDVDYVRVRVIYSTPTKYYYDPISDSQTGWTCSGADCGTGHYAVLDDGNRYPNSPNTTDYIYEAAGGGTDEHAINTINQTSIEYITLWAYASTGTNCQLYASLQNDGAEVASKTVNPGTGISWVSANWTAPSNVGTITTEFSSTKNGTGSAQNCYVYSWYIEVNTPPLKTGAVSTFISDVPFYTTDSNPQDYTDESCLGEMADGNSCEVSWQVNATGDLNTTHEFFVLFDMTTNSNYVDGTETPHINITIGDIENIPPEATLESPSPGYITNNSTVVFNCSATDNSGLKNMTLYGNFNGTFSENGTNLLSGKSNSTTFTRTLNDGVYEWNCRAYDTDENDDWGDSNRTLTIDTTRPYINLTGPDDNDTFYTDTINFNFTVTDNIDSQMQCNLTINSTVKDSNFNADNLFMECNMLG